MSVWAPNLVNKVGIEGNRYCGITYIARVDTAGRIRQDTFKLTGILGMLLI